MSVLTYRTVFVLFLEKDFVDVFIIVETNKRIKGPDIDFGVFLQFIGICLLITEIPGTKRAEYFS